MKYTIILLMLVFFGCTSTNNSTTIWVNSYQVDCTGVGPMKCMLIQEGETPDENNWQNFYSKIEGFNFEPGYIYKLKVAKENVENVPADASSVKYILVEILEKKEDKKLGLNGNWNAVKIIGSVVNLPRSRGAGLIPELQIDISKMQISGIDNCNSFTGKINKIGESSIDFGPIAATQKMCPDMTIADAFGQALNAVKNYKLMDNTLIFTDDEGAELLEFSRKTEAKVLLNDIWVAEIVDGKTVADQSKAPRLEINSSKLEVNGTDGCNNLIGKIVKLTNDELVFGPLAVTRKMCSDMAIPDAFNKAIQLVTHYKIANLKLSLLDDQGKVLIALKKVD